MRSATPTPSTPVSRNRAAATCTMRSWLSSLSAFEWPIPTPSILALDIEDYIRHPQFLWMTIVIHNELARFGPITLAISREMIMNFIRRIRFVIAAVGALAIAACATNAQASNEKPATANPKQQVVELLKSIETGDSKPLAYINPDKYIQHNLAVGDGLTGVKALLQSLPKGSAKVNTVRVYQEGDFVFAHTE